MKTAHKYRDLSHEKLEELFSNYLMDSWSFSKVSSFARNEKSFEMTYIYRQPQRRSASEVSGSAYHVALQYYFKELINKNVVGLVDLQTIAYNYIDEVPANSWKIQKTNPTIEDCVSESIKTVNELLSNFLTDISVYELDGCEILGVELKLDNFLTINGVDIPLPCHGVVDLALKLKDGKIVLIDHKSKKSFTDEKELKFSIGKQAITYVKLFELAFDLVVNEVWFIENKSSKNREKSPQLACFKVQMDKDARSLYEALLYEPLKRMLEAISNPDYVYLINESDNFIDKAEIYEFWAQTQIAEISDYLFIPDNKRELIEKRIKKIRDSSISVVDPKTIRKFRENASEFIQFDLTNKNMTNEEKIEHVLRNLGTQVKVSHTFNGYSSNTYLLEVSAQISLASIFKYKLDLANALNVSAIRMNKDLYVYEGKSYLSVESSKTRENILSFDKSKLVGSKIPIGVDNFGNTIIWDVENPSTPHVLICGSTGSGKSVAIISIIEYAKLYGFEHIVIFDPKFEFKNYQSKDVDVFNDIEEIEATMSLMVDEMQTLVKNGIKKKTLIVFDEFADAVASSRKGKELEVYEDVCIGVYQNGLPKMKRQNTSTLKSLEENLKILLQKGRSSGYRIIAATQRASVKVITGDAKVNFPVLICFKVPKAVDSKVVIDEEGAEALQGKGDGLIKSPEYGGVVRFQAFYKN